MLHLAHLIIVALYIALPVAALVHAVWQARRGWVRPVGNLLMLILIGSIVGTAAATSFAMVAGGSVGVMQFFLAIYFAVAMLLVLGAMDAVVRRGMLWLVRSRPADQTDPRAVRRVAAQRAVVALARGIVLVGIGMPYVVANVVTFRLKSTPDADPARILGHPYDQVAFEASDGMELAGWWIPAHRVGSDSTSGGADFGEKTVILCHGLFANKATQLALARRLIPDGYNVLVFDFRAHGSSGGHLAGMGAVERLDVLAAVRWVQEAHPQACKRIVGIGVNTGAAALIAAAVDPSPQGQSIESLVVFSGISDLASLARDYAARTLLPPMDRVTYNIAVPLASLQVGADLADFKPETLVHDLWPRPIMVVQPTHDPLVSFEQGQRLFDAASFPKRALWLSGEDQSQAIRDERAAAAVRDFLVTARPRSII
jgi:alpha-beta hydrolase superfamily lysophospholipase